jgi:hypothetical protein
MTDPRQAEVWGKKPEVADRTLNERKYCKPCDYYYSEMFTCPICYGDDRAVERIIKMLEEASIGFQQFDSDSVATTNFLIRLIKGEK